MNNGILGYYTELCGVGFDDLEFDGAHTTTDEESVTLPHGSICCDAVMLRCEIDHEYDDAYLQGNMA